MGPGLEGIRARVGCEVKECSASRAEGAIFCPLHNQMFGAPAGGAAASYQRAVAMAVAAAQGKADVGKPQGEWPSHDKGRGKGTPTFKG